MTVSVFATCPLPYAVVGAVGLALFWRRLPRGLRVAGVAIEVALVVLMTPLSANALSGWLRSRVPPASACTAPTPNAIVVLGGGAERRPMGSDDYAALHLVSLQRLFAGVALWRHMPGARLVIAGGSRGHIPEAMVLANLAAQMGVPTKAIEIEDRSSNTWENARNVAMLSPPVPQRIWLVTSSVHLPRALGAFHAWGFQPCAWPADAIRGASGLEPGFIIPTGDSVETTTVALHELLGGVEYAWLEWRHARRSTHEHATGQPQTP
ncbi:MAG: YdcF family protein [Xanthomonadaceae bacterium]|nr:YdcF family protein [Xanthomonadaceae bacterium]